MITFSRPAMSLAAGVSFLIAPFPPASSCAGQYPLIGPRAPTSLTDTSGKERAPPARDRTSRREIESRSTPCGWRPPLIPEACNGLTGKGETRHRSEVPDAGGPAPHRWPWPDALVGPRPSGPVGRRPSPARWSSPPHRLDGAPELGAEREKVMLANAGAAARDRMVACGARHHDAGIRKTQKRVPAAQKVFAFHAEIPRSVAGRSAALSEPHAPTATPPRVLEPLPSGALTSRRQPPLPRALGLAQAYPLAHRGRGAPSLVPEVRAGAPRQRHAWVKRG
jgi:hypothetical protein